MSSGDSTDRGKQAVGSLDRSSGEQSARETEFGGVVGIGEVFKTMRLTMIQQGESEERRTTSKDHPSVRNSKDSKKAN